MQALADRVDNRLDNIAPGQITGVAAGRLLIANGSGVVTGVALSGDATINSAGVLEIGAAKVGAIELADQAVTTAKVDASAITTPKVALSARTQAKIISLGGLPAGQQTISWDTAWPAFSPGPTYAVALSLISTVNPGTTPKFYVSTITNTSIQVTWDLLSANASSAIHAVAKQLG